MLRAAVETDLGKLFVNAINKRDQHLNPVAPYAEFKFKPVEYCRDILKVTLEDYQVDRITATADPNINAIGEVSGNGPGKSFLDACTALWFVDTHPLGVVLEIEPTEDQIKRNFMSEISRLMRNAGDKLNHLQKQSLEVFHKDYKEEWFIAGRISNNPENVKSARSNNMMIIFGEAQGIGREIMAAARTRLTSNEPGAVLKRIATGNPGYVRTGPFYDIMKKDGFEDLWTRFHISCIDSPRVSDEFIKEIELEYGIDSPEYTVMVLGDWPNTSISNLCTEEQYNQAINKSVTPLGDNELGLDISRKGSHRTVLTHSNNGTVVNMWKWTHQDLMKTADRCAKHIDDLSPTNVFIDDTGVGGGVTDRLLQLNFSEDIIKPINFGMKASQPDRFVSIKAEMLNNVSRLLEENSLSLINVAKDADLQHQLLNSYIDHEPRGKQRLRVIDAYAGKTTKSCDELHSVALSLLNTLPTCDHTVAVLITDDSQVITRRGIMDDDFGCFNDNMQLNPRSIH